MTQNRRLFEEQISRKASEIGFINIDQWRSGGRGIHGADFIKMHTPDIHQHHIQLQDSISLNRALVLGLVALLLNELI